MGGLAFFCTKVDEPEGHLELLVESVKAMNVQADPNDEERKVNRTSSRKLYNISLTFTLLHSQGCSGHIGKMVFSCSSEKVCIVGYVPEEKKDEIDAKVWVEHVVNLYGGKVVGGDSILATGEILSDPEADKFALKIRDEALPKAIDYLRSKGLFPEAKDESSDDDFCMGDDFFETLE